MADRPETAADMLDVVIYVTADIASDLLKIGDRHGANALVVLIKTLEQFKEPRHG